MRVGIPDRRSPAMVALSTSSSEKEGLLPRARHGRRPPRPRLRLPTVQPPGTGREAFMRLVEEAVESIPEQFRERLANVDFVIEETPRGDEVEGGELLLGLYQGVPLTERDAGYFGVLPDRIVLFRRPIEARARSDADLAELVREVVIHEVAHYFGIDDDRLDELGW
jgi:predicted Zn-dependent protease with MMP-like domain